MNRFARAICMIMMLTPISACVAIPSVPAGPVAMGSGHSLTVGRQWSDVSAILPQRQKKVRVLSIDGPLLNRLYIAQGLDPKEGLTRAISKEHPAPTYHRDMSPNELVEFVTDSVASLGYRRVESSGLRPGKFGQSDALRFDLTAVTQSGLEISGTAQVADAGGKLYVVLYLAPTEHYFKAQLPEVESLIKSAS